MALAAQTLLRPFSTPTATTQAQADRNLFTSMGRTTAAVANAGLTKCGSALEILRESARHGATTKAVLGA
jgi:hypothetical protein